MLQPSVLPEARIRIVSKESVINLRQIHWVIDEVECQESEYLFDTM